MGEGLESSLVGMLWLYVFIIIIILTFKGQYQINCTKGKIESQNTYHTAFLLKGILVWYTPWITC